ncbi:recombinase family protein [Curtobacterium sp. MCPF17_031]|uniref:recombinase family protein n=1 Tax=Curtobacterium sp. MCPF17_031 TaxID=2175653 RepID=UPI0015E89920|nr:recombinase family protein [Curtobacterium sp. MCPF17_031]
MIAAAIYARQSKDNDEGIERQLERIRALVAARGWQVVREYSDNDRSASKPRGAGSDWAALLADADRDVFTHLVAVDLDRLVRSQTDLLGLIERRLAVVTVDGELDLSTADGEFRASLAASLARFEVRRKGERTRRANQYRRSQGRLTPGRRLYGYESDGVTVREAEAAIVRRVYAHVAGGGTIYSIAAALRTEGVPMTTSAAARRDDPAAGWIPARIRDMILNRRYSGMVPLVPDTNEDGDPLTATERARARRDPANWQPSSNVPSVVPADDAERARAIVLDPTRRITPGPARRHLLSGLVTCGHRNDDGSVCGAGLKRTRTEYRCSKTPRHPSILARTIEPMVRAAVVWDIATSGPELVSRAEPMRDVGGLLRRHAANERAQAQTVRDRDDGLLSAAVAHARLVELRAERESVEAELDRLRTEQSALGALLTIAAGLLGSTRSPSSLAIARAGSDVREGVAARFDALDLDRQREVIRALLDVQLQPGRGMRRVIIEHRLTGDLDPAE